MTGKKLSLNIRSETILAAFLSVMALVGIILPRALGFMPAVAGLLMFVFLVLYRRQSLPLSRTYLGIFAGVAALALASSLWSFDAADTLERGAKIAGVLLGGVLLFAVVRVPGILDMQKLARWLILAFLAGGLFCIAEMAAHGWLHHRWAGTNMYDDYLNVSMMNRSVIVFTLLWLPVWDMHKRAVFSPNEKRLIRITMLAMLSMIMVQTDSQSAQLAVLTGGVFYGLFPLMRKGVWIALAALICGGVMIMPWVVQYLYDAMASRVDNMAWLSSAYASHRLEIWDFIARKAMENPWYGFGLEATRYIEHFDTAKLYTPHDHVLHPHNAVLQAWIEFGVVGALAFCATVLAILRGLYAQEQSQARSGLTIFMAVLIIACTSYGLWQSWWIGLFTFIAALLGLQGQMPRKQR
ncbi:MAG: O-antigen ligase family protein [Magnetococcus sp. WYHC-3]